MSAAPSTNRTSPPNVIDRANSGLNWTHARAREHRLRNSPVRTVGTRTDGAAGSERRATLATTHGQTAPATSCPGAHEGRHCHGGDSFDAQNPLAFHSGRRARGSAWSAVVAERGSSRCLRVKLRDGYRVGREGSAFPREEAPGGRGAPVGQRSPYSSGSNAIPTLLQHCSNTFPTSRPCVGKTWVSLEVCTLPATGRRDAVRNKRRHRRRCTAVESRRVPSRPRPGVDAGVGSSIFDVIGSWHRCSWPCGRLDVL